MSYSCISVTYGPVSNPSKHWLIKSDVGGTVSLLPLLPEMNRFPRVGDMAIKALVTLTESIIQFPEPTQLLTSAYKFNSREI